MLKLLKIIRKYPIYLSAILLLCGIVGYGYYTRPNSQQASGEVPQVHLLADVAPQVRSITSICDQLNEKAATPLCQQVVQQAIANANKPAIVCRKIFWFEFSCHSESNVAPINDSVCKKLLSEGPLLGKFLFKDQVNCLSSLQAPQPKPVAQQTESNPVITPALPPIALSLSLPEFPGALQIAGLGSSPTIKGPAFFSAVYSRNKPSTYPPSRYALVLGESFLQVSGKITSAKYDHNSAVIITGSVDTTDRIITCTLLKIERTLSCSLRSGGAGITDHAIQLLPKITFYNNTLVTNFADF